MNNNYLNNRENTYRQGVLQGNYIEEIYAHDYEKSKRKEPRIFMSETKERYKTFFNQPNAQSVKKTDTTGNNCKDLEPVSQGITVNCSNKKNICEVTDEDFTNQKEEENREQIITTDNEEKTRQEFTKPDLKTDTLQSYKRIIEPDLDLEEHNHSAKKVNSEQDLDRLEISEPQFANNGRTCGRKSNDDYSSTYNMIYNKHLRPQDIYVNNQRSNRSISKPKLANNTENQGNNNNASLAAGMKSFAKKNQEFTKTFDKNYMNLGFRN